MKSKKDTSPFRAATALESAEALWSMTEKSAISDKLVYLYKDHILNASHILPMNYQTADGALVVSKGAAVILEDKCYFVKYDNYNSGLQSINDLYNCATNSTSSAALVSAYEIADEATLKAIKDARFLPCWELLSVFPPLL